MSEVGHTPEPWQTDGRYIIGKDEFGNIFALATIHYDILAGRAKANARLMATSPELLKKLEALVYAIDALMENAPEAVHVLLDDNLADKMCAARVIADKARGRENDD